MLGRILAWLAVLAVAIVLLVLLYGPGRAAGAGQSSPIKGSDAATGQRPAPVSWAPVSTRS